jgi:hypothetical protein
MANQPRHPDTRDETSPSAGAVPGAARPRWKTALVIVIVIAVLALFIVLHVTGVVGAGTNG